MGDRGSMIGGLLRSGIAKTMQRQDSGEHDLVSHPEGEEGAVVAKSDAGSSRSVTPVGSGDVSVDVPTSPSHKSTLSLDNPFARVRLASVFEEPASSLPLFSEREAMIVRMSNRLLQLFWLCGTIFTALVLWQLITEHSEKHVIAWSVAAIFVAVAVPFSLHDIHMHVMHYVCPELQKYYIRILWMVPIYSVESWLALRFRSQKIFLETAREAYEAYVIYNFYMLMLNYLGGGQAVRDILSDQAKKGKKYVRLFFPFCCWQWKRSGQFINRCTVGVFQYVIIRFFCAFITCTVEYMRDEGMGNHHKIEQTITAIIIIINLSQIWALFCLVQFYHELKDELKDISPLPKFLVVKTIIFLSFWQGLAIVGLAHEGFITSYMDYSTDDVASGIQDFLICLEMAMISYAHKFVFSYRDMEKIIKLEKQVARPPSQAFYDILPWDVLDDFREQMFNGFGVVHKLEKKRRRLQQLEELALSRVTPRAGAAHEHSGAHAEEEATAEGGGGGATTATTEC